MKVLIPTWLSTIADRVKPLLAVSQIPTVPRFLISMKNGVVMAEHAANIVNATNVNAATDITNFASQFRPESEPYIKELLFVFASKKLIHQESFTPCNVLDGIGTRVHVTLSGTGVLSVGSEKFEYETGTVFAINKEQQSFIHSLDLDTPTVQLVIACSADPRPVWKIFSTTNR